MKEDVVDKIIAFEGVCEQRIADAVEEARRSVATAEQEEKNTTARMKREIDLREKSRYDDAFENQRRSREKALEDLAERQRSLLKEAGLRGEALNAIVAMILER
ncbi:MAG: hypothetical protein JW884_12580 [Deltaproteobacteria bacterium]|nr:hypothetical protein [Deltaproteobacteria bacterium]